VAANDPWPDLADPRRARGSRTCRVLGDLKPDLLLVDLFWAPLYYILPTLGCEAWLLLRWVPKVWLRGPAGTPFDARQFRRIIGTEPFHTVDLPEYIDPIVVANPDECHPPEALRDLLHVGRNQHLTLVMQAGLEEEADVMAPDDAKGVVVTLNLHRDAWLFPAAPYLGGADRIITGAGYNAFWEARWLKYYDRCRCVPFARQIDNQFWRAKEAANLPIKHNGADTLVRMILG